ncbi:hypothetical protein ES707_18095 [subsurface metagenome]
MSEFNDEEEIINEDFEEDDEEFEEDVEEKMKDVGELKEILQAVSTEIPDLIKGIFGSLYSSEIANEYGKGVGSLYKELKNQGLPEEMIRKIISDFTSNVNILGNIKVNKDRSSKELISLNSLT